MSTIPKDKRRYKVTIEDRKEGTKIVLEVHGMGLQMDRKSDLRSDVGTAACVKITMDYPTIKTGIKKTKKVKKGKKNGK